MTTTRSKVRRVTVEEYNVLRVSARHAKQIVVTIGPGDVLSFHEKRGKTQYYLSISTAFKFAVNLEAMRVAREKKEAKKAKKFGGA